MALTFVGGTTGLNGSAVDLTALTGGIGSAPIAGDIVIITVSVGHGNDSGGVAISIDGGTYNQLGTQLNANDNNDVSVATFYKIMGGTPDTSVQPVSASGLYACVVHVWRGVDQSTPIDTTTLTATGTNASLVDSPSIQPVTAGAIVISTGAMADGDPSTVTTTPAGYGNMFERNRSGTVDTCCVIASKAWSGSGAENPANWVFSNGASSDCWGAFSIVLRPASSTNYPLTAALGTFTLTGISSLFKIGIKMTAVLGTFTLTGINAIISFGRKMLAALGTFTLTGYDATLFYGKLLTALTGAFTLTGNVATITSTRKLIADLGTFTLSGIAAAFSVGHTLVANVGTFVLTGINAVITSTRTMVAALGQFTLTGIAALFPRASIVAANTGVFILSGANVAFSGARKMVAAVGTFVLTGIAATFPRASQVFANTGVFNLVGYTAIGLINGVSSFWVAQFPKNSATTANTQKNSANSSNVPKS